MQQKNLRKRETWRCSSMPVNKKWCCAIMQVCKWSQCLEKLTLLHVCPSSQTNARPADCSVVMQDFLVCIEDHNMICCNGNKEAIDHDFSAAVNITCFLSVSWTSQAVICIGRREHFCSFGHWEPLVFNIFPFLHWQTTQQFFPVKSTTNKGRNATNNALKRKFPTLMFH